MINDFYDVVDLGAKKGNAAFTFLGLLNRKDTDKRKPPVLRSPDFSPKLFNKDRVICFDKSDSVTYKNTINSRGYTSVNSDLSDDQEISNLPKAKVYLAWHFLEHLPNKEVASKVVKQSLSNATSIAWFRLPSFEQDNLGELPLREMGLRFTWTNWKGHPCHWLLSDCLESISDWADNNKLKEYQLTVKCCDYIKSTSDSRVVPISAPVDTNKYSEEMGSKPIVSFKPPLVAAWDVIVRFK